MIKPIIKIGFKRVDFFPIFQVGLWYDYQLNQIGFILSTLGLTFTLSVGR